MFIDLLFFMLMGILAIPGVCGYYAYSRGRSFWLWFLIGSILPVISYFILVLLPDKSNPIEGELEELRVQHKLLGTSPDIPAGEVLKKAVEQEPISYISFDPVLDSHPKELKIMIDGQDLITLMKAWELPYAQAENNKHLAGAYRGVPLSLALPPYKHFLGEPSRKFSVGKRPVILIANDSLKGEGSPKVSQAWKLTISIAFYRRVVVWHSFRQEAKRNEWSYYQREMLVFNRLQYEEALRELENCMS